MKDQSQRVTWPPRLVGVSFAGPRPFLGQNFLRLSGLTVLFGANGAGKTTTLRVLSEDLPALAAAGLEHETGATACTFFVELSDQQLDLLADDALASQQGSAATPIKWAGPELPDEAVYAAGEGDDPRAAWLSTLREAARPDAEEFRRGLEGLAGSRIVSVKALGTSGPYVLTWCLAQDGQQAGGPVAVAPLGVTARTMLPTAVSVPRELDEIRLELRDSIVAVLDHLRWAERDHWARAHGLPLPEVHSRRGTQAWLADPHAEVAAVSTDARALCRLASVLATRLAPEFVSKVHSIRVAIDPIYEWERGGPALALQLSRGKDVNYPLRRAADGHKVWLQLALLEATAILRRYLDVLEALFDRAQTSLAGGEDALASYKAATDLLRPFGGREPPDESAIKRFTALRNVGHRLYLIDEPEQHLHPRVQRFAADWLASSGTSGASQVVVVTHSAHYLRLPGDVGFAYLRSLPGGQAGPHSVIDEVTPELLAASDGMAKELGFDRGELLTSVAAFVFVEGQADKLMLEAFCGGELHHAGIALVPIHGAVHADRKGVVDSELVLTWTAANLGVLLDNLAEAEWTRLERDVAYCEEQARKAKMLELRAMAQIMVRAREVGRTITPIGIPVPDIFDLLDEDVVAALYPRFPGHAAARTMWEEQNSEKAISWKKYYADAYGIVVEPQLFAEVGAEMAKRGVRPEGIDELVGRLKALTAVA